ncbi:relaxase/mobilization nuclease domain-containing protein [Nocardia aurea]|uniref:MobA/VirD2-like nuclease domain-containing protein n=1 Tax=Nocardia aurea TaxID=2144174 RepID=A0ABV3G4X1_9NOCA
MMPNIVKGSDMVGLLRYLAGPGRAEEHTNPRVIAGDVVTMAVYAGAIDVARANELAKLLDSPRQTVLRGQPVMATNYRAAYAAIEAGTPRREAFDAATRDENVWHCALSLDPREGRLEEAKWGEISRRFMQEMGFIDAADGAPDVRWSTVHHGLTKADGDHVHIAMGRVRPDGSIADARRDWPRAQAAARVIEKEFGLRVLASREFGGTEQATRPDERARAARVGAPETDRDALRRRVRAVALASESEAEFVRELRQGGVMLRPRYAKGGTDEVVGYSVRMPAQKNLTSGRWEKAIWFGGGHLAKDLTLTSMRGWAGWAHSPQAREDALTEWGRSDKTRSGRALRPDRMSQKEAIGQLTRWSEYMRTIPLEDRDAWAKAASQTAGLFAAASLRTETTPGPLDRLSRQLARAAQMPAHQRRPWNVHGSGTRAVARMLWASKSPEAANLALVAALTQCLLTVGEMLDATARAEQATEMATQARQALTEIHKRAVGITPTRPHVREPGSPGWAAERRAAAVMDGVGRAEREGLEAEIVEARSSWEERNAAFAARTNFQRVDDYGHPVGTASRKGARTMVVQPVSGPAVPTDNAARLTQHVDPEPVKPADTPKRRARPQRRVPAFDLKEFMRIQRPDRSRPRAAHDVDDIDAAGTSSPPEPEPDHGSSEPRPSSTRDWEKYMPPPGHQHGPDRGRGNDMGR